MRHSVTFTIPGRLGGKQRAGRQIQFRHNAKPIIRSFNPEQTARQEGIVAQLAALARRGMPTLLGAVSLQIAVYRHTPASWSKKRTAAAKWITGKPDADNTVKLICDGLNHSGVWKDDAQVASVQFERQYCNGIEEGVVVTVAALEEQS